MTQVKEYDFVAYSSIPRNAQGRVYQLPSGVTPVRISNTEYYNPVPEASSTTYTDADSYNLSSSPRLIQLPAAAEIQNGSGTPKSRSEMMYDYTSYTSNTKGGNLIQTKAWDS